MGRPIPPIEVTEEQLKTLEAWTRRSKMAQALVQRARVVLLCAAGKSNAEVARMLRQSQQMVDKWRSRFRARGVEGLLGERRRCGVGAELDAGDNAEGRIGTRVRWQRAAA